MKFYIISAMIAKYVSNIPTPSYHSVGTIHHVTSAIPVILLNLYLFTSKLETWRQFTLQDSSSETSTYIHDNVTFITKVISLAGPSVVSIFSVPSYVTNL